MLLRPAVGLYAMSVSQLEAGIRKRIDMNTSVQELQGDCFWSQYLGQGSNCTNSLDPNATSVNSSGGLMLAELIASVLERKDLGEDLQVSNTILQKVGANKCEKRR